MLTRGDVEESGASVDDTGSAGRDRGGAVLHGLVDAPVEGGGRSGGDGTVESKIRNGLCQTLEGYVRVGDGAGELGGVSSAESELAVGVLLRGRRCEGDSDKVGRDQALGEGIASDYDVQLSSVHIQMRTKGGKRTGGDSLTSSGAEGALGQVEGTDTATASENTLHI